MDLRAAAVPPAVWRLHVPRTLCPRQRRPRRLVLHGVRAHGRGEKLGAELRPLFLQEGTPLVPMVVRLAAPAGSEHYARAPQRGLKTRTLRTGRTGQSSGGHGWASQVLRRRDGESQSRRTGHRFQEMADRPELKCPGERLLSRTWRETAFNQKDGTLGWAEASACPSGAGPAGTVTWGLVCDTRLASSWIRSFGVRSENERSPKPRAYDSVDCLSMNRNNSPGVGGTFRVAAQEKGHPQEPLAQNASLTDRNSYRATTDSMVPRAGPASGFYSLVTWNAAFTNEDKRQGPLVEHRSVRHIS